MQTNNCTNFNVTLRTDFGKYLTVEAFPHETLNDLVLRIHETCGSSITIENFQLYGRNIDGSEKILQLFQKANKFNPSLKISNKKLCRLCAQNRRHLMNIFASGTDYSEMIRTCLSIEVNVNDKLPIKICKTCIGILSEFYKFKQKTTEAELKLKTYFKCSDNLTSSFRNASVMLDSNELFQTSEADCYMEEDFNTFDEASDNLFGSSENQINSADAIDDDEESSENEEKPFPCRWCTESFDVIDELYKHALIHSNKKKRFVKVPRKTIRIEKKQTCYVCTICDQVFPVKEFFEQHCDALHKTLDKLLTGFLVQLSRVFSCYRCDAKYLRLKQLQKHIQKCSLSSITINSEVRNEREKLWCIPTTKTVQYVCEYCTRDFADSKYLKKHSRGTDVLGIEKEFTCQDCARSFTSECSLKYHAKIHNETKNFICETCGETYKNSGSLQSHRKKHSVERPFPCNTCDRVFKTREYLKIHQRQHTGERPYNCGTCDKSFRTPGQASLHRRIHLPTRAYSCPMCPKTFRRSCHRSIHMLSHTGERPHKCEYCEATFRYRVYMKKHMQNCRQRTTENEN